MAVVSIFMPICYSKKVISIDPRSPETKLGPINYLIVMDQINGLFLAVSIVMRITFIASPMPMSSVAGHYFCNVANLAGAVYIGGSYIWSSYIALFRVLFIKAKDLFGVDLEVNSFLLGMLTTGAFLLV